MDKIFDDQIANVIKLIETGNCEEAVRESGMLLGLANEVWTERHNEGKIDDALMADFANIAMLHVQSLQLAGLLADAFTTAVTALWQMSLDKKFNTCRSIDVAVIAILNSAITSFLGSLPELIPVPGKEDHSHADAILSYLASILYARYNKAKSIDIEPVKLAYTILSDMRRMGNIQSPDVVVPVDGKETAVPADDLPAIMPDLVGRAVALGFKAD